MIASMSRRIALVLSAAAAALSTGAYAQLTSFSSGTITLTPSSSPSPLVGTQTVECGLSTEIAGQPASLLLNASQAVTVNGAMCWEIYSSDGGIVRTPVTFTVPDFSPTSVSFNAAEPTEAVASTSGSSSSRAVKVIVPALIGSLVGVILLALATVYFFRLRARRKSQASRARRWVNRNSASFAMKETSQKARQDEVTFPQQPAYPFSSGQA